MRSVKRLSWYSTHQGSSHFWQSFCSRRATLALDPNCCHRLMQGRGWTTLNQTSPDRTGCRLIFPRGEINRETLQGFISDYLWKQFWPITLASTFRSVTSATHNMNQWISLVGAHQAWFLEVSSQLQLGVYEGSGRIWHSDIFIDHCVWNLIITVDFQQTFPVEVVNSK